MRQSNAKSYPEEGMSLIYANGANLVYQAVFQTKNYGTFTRVDGQWLALSPEDTSLENLSIMDILPADYKVVTDMFDASQKARRYLSYDKVKEYEVAYSFEGNSKAMTAAVETSKGCPPATQDVALNLENRQKAIDNVGYGPLNPALPNNAFWQDKGDRWNITPEEAKTARCGNCIFFIRTPKMLECIESGIGLGTEEAQGSIEAGELGYCNALDFKCASKRTCNAWAAGGPVTEESSKA